MERTTFSVLFFIRRTRLNKSGESPIEMRITINGTRGESAIKRYIRPAYWSSAKGCAIGKTKECKELNVYLDSIKYRLMQMQRDMEMDGIEVNPRTLLNRYNGIDAKAKYTVLGLYQEHNDRCEKLVGIDMARATYIRYTTSLNHIAEFIQHNYGVKDLPIEEVTHKFITDYEFYMKSVRMCSHNTVTKYIKNFKKIINIALVNDIIAKDPFCHIKFRFEEVERDFLDEDELQRIAEKEFSIERLECVRDVFLFCCYTGLAFADVKQLRAEHIVADNTGAQWIRKRRQKTKNMCNIPLLDEARAILARYRGYPMCEEGALLPVYSNQRYNSYLKEIADMCGVKKLITSHVARHTFSTTIALANGVSMENVAKMLGHSDTKMTRHYAKVLDKSILQDMEFVNRRIKKR